MNIKYRNKFNKAEIEDYTKQIGGLITNEANLSFRSFRTIRKILEQGEAILAFSDNKIIAFIFREKINLNYFELGALYCVPEYRKTGVSWELFEYAIKDTKKNYLFFTFQNEIIGKTSKYHFNAISFNKLNVFVLFKILLKRFSIKRISEVLRHSKKAKVYLLLKTAER